MRTLYLFFLSYARYERNYLGVCGLGTVSLVAHYSTCTEEKQDNLSYEFIDWFLPGYFTHRSYVLQTLKVVFKLLLKDLGMLLSLDLVLVYTLMISLF